MVERRLYLVLLALALLVSVLHAERARNDHRQDDDEDNRDDEVIETIKRFLRGKKTTTTTKAPSSDSISALITTTRSTPTTKSSVTSRFDRTRLSTASPKDACGLTNPCRNGGTCKTLSKGNYYCFCSQDYYGKNCENKFMSTGTANNDRGKVDHCAKSPCRNGGECVGLRTTFYCRCKSPYYGINCDKKIGKREEIIDEEDLIAYERDLEADNEDLREMISEQNDA